MTHQSLTIRESTQADDDAIAQHLHHLMLELGSSAQAMAPDWLHKTHIFIELIRGSIGLNRHHARGRQFLVQSPKSI